MSEHLPHSPKTKATCTQFGSLYLSMRSIVGDDKGNGCCHRVTDQIPRIHRSDTSYREIEASRLHPQILSCAQPSIAIH